MSSPTSLPSRPAALTSIGNSSTGGATDDISNHSRASLRAIAMVQRVQHLPETPSPGAGSKMHHPQLSSLVGSQLGSVKEADNEAEEHEQVSVHGDDDHKDIHHHPIFIPKSSRLFCWCGPHDHSWRLAAYEFVERRRLQLFLVLLLLIDIICVLLELAFSYRILAPAPDQTMSSLYVPREYVCGTDSTVDSHSELETCCAAFLNAYPHTDIFGQGKGASLINTQYCMNKTSVHFSSSSSSSASHGSAAGSSTSSHSRMMRMLLSASSHAGPPVRCYERPAKFAPHHHHYDIEVFLHWLSVSILAVFLLELLVLVYAQGPMAFFCSCRWIVEEEDVVVVEDAETGEVTAANALVLHRNSVSGEVLVRPFNTLQKDPTNSYTQSQLLHEPYWNVRPHHESKRRYCSYKAWYRMCCKAPVESVDIKSIHDRERHKVCCCRWYNGPFVLDFFVVIMSLVLENLPDILSTTAADEQDFSHLVARGGLLLIIIRGWRVLRFIHGVHESNKKFSTRIRNTESELTTIVVENFRRLVEIHMAIQKGYATPEHLYRAFLYEFGNMDKPQSKQASSGGINYIYQLTQHIEAEEVVGQEVSMRAPHPKATSRGIGGDAIVADSKQLNPLMEVATDDPSQQ